MLQGHHQILWMNFIRNFVIPRNGYNQINLQRMKTYITEILPLSLENKEKTND
jgi:hypothetical protein